MAQSPAELFATSWTLHRLSPLYHSKEFANTLLDAPESLRVYANRLRDTLTGNVLNGIVQAAPTESTALDDAIAKAGALIECQWENLPTWDYWNEEHSILDDPDQPSPLVITAEQSVGILISLKYENINYKAVLIAGPDGYDYSNVGQQEGITYLPLLVTRMPNGLRQTLISFLSTSFDARASILRLPSSFLCASLESYLATLNHVPSLMRKSGMTSLVEPETCTFIESVVKETQLTFSFSPPAAPSLKTLEVLLPRASLSAFYAHGVNNNNHDEVEHSSPPKPPQTQYVPSASFLSALSEYFDTNLAMKLDLVNFKEPRTKGKDPVRLTKVSCGAFVLGAEGRVKLLANPGRTVPFDDSELDYFERGEVADVDEKQKGLVWRANEELLRALVLKAMEGIGWELMSG